MLKTIFFKQLQYLPLICQLYQYILPLVNWFLILVDGSKILKEPAVFIDEKKVGFKELEEFLMTEPDSYNKSSLMTQFEYVHIKYFTLHIHICIWCCNKFTPLLVTVAIF